MARTETFEDRVLLAAQAITPTPTDLDLPSGGSASFDVFYSTAGNEEQTAGLDIRMHFDSSEVSFGGLTNLFTTGQGATPTVTDDPTANGGFDGDPNTDMYVNFLWLDIGGNWPGTSNDQPLQIFTATFSPTDSFDGSLVNFSGSEAANSTLDVSTSVSLNVPPPTPELSVSDATVTEGGNLEFEVSVTGDSPNGNVTVDVATSNGSAIAGDDYTAHTETLTFVSGGARSQTVVVSTLQDIIPENSETLTLTLSNEVNANLADSTGLGTIDDDGDLSEVTISGSPVVGEGESLVFTVSLNVAPLSDVIVALSTSDGTAEAGPDYAAISNQLITFTPTGPLTQTVTVASVEDDIAETPVSETFFVDLLSATNATIAENQATGTIIDDDGNGAVGGIKFHDRNLNGVQDSGEEGLEGWEITLTDTVSSTAFATATTEADGTYLITEVPPGLYAVTETLQVGWLQSAPIGGLSQKAYDLDQSLDLFTAGNEFEDWGGLGEKWVQGNAGWYYILPDGSFFQWKGSPQTQLTGEFVDVLSSVYHEKLELLYDAVEPVGHVFELESNQQLTDIDFGNYALGSIDGRKFGDLDDNGAFDIGEPWLPGWTIQLLDLNGNLLQTDVTDADGRYSFHGLEPTEYLAREVPQEGFRQTLPEIDPDTVLAEQAFSLDQQRGFIGTPNDFFDWGGRHEKWFQSASGYHFVTPTGKIYEWDGSSRDDLTGILVGELDSSYYQDPVLIYDAQFPGGTPITVGSGESITHHFGNAEFIGDGFEGGSDYGEGNVAVAVRSGDLIIHGDGLSNGVSVFLDADGHVVVDGLGLTTINGSDDLFVAFQSTNEIQDDLRINLGDGANLLLLKGFNVNDDVRIVSGGGADYLLLDNVNVGDDLFVKSSNGDDIIAINEVGVADKTIVSSDAGDDVVAALSSVLNSRTRIRTFGGADLVYTDDSRFGGDLDVDLDSGNDQLAALGSNIAGEAALNGGGDFDSLFHEDTTAGTFTSNEFESNTIDNLDAEIDAVLERLALRGIEFS